MLKKISIETAIMLLSCLISIVANCQHSNNNCDTLKNGKFYFVDKTTGEPFSCTRNADYQVEHNLKTGDTILYKIEWSDKCGYALKYISTNAKMSAEFLSLMEKHKIVCAIVNVTPDYYVYKGYFDKTSNALILTDTMWLKPRLTYSTASLIEPVKNEQTLKRAHFTDTSKYSILYIYRSRRFSGSMADMLIYFNDNLVCISQNNSAYIFRINKEGSFKLSSILEKEKPVVLPLDIQFGKRYYVKSSDKFTMKTLCGWTAELKLMDNEKGADEFLSVY